LGCHFKGGACIEVFLLALIVFETQVLKTIFGIKREEVRGEVWRKLHIEELHNLYSLLDITTVIK
jgi:hypothetical protein